MTFVTDKRWAGGNKRNPNYTETCVCTFGRSLANFIEYEIGFGGTVIEVITKDGLVSLTIETRFFDTVDHTTYVDESEKMRLFIECGLLSNALKEEIFKDESELGKRVFNNVMNITKGLPILLKLGGGILISTPIVRACLIHVCSDGDEALMKALVESEVTNKDLRAAFELVWDKGLSKDSYYELLGLPR